MNSKRGGNKIKGWRNMDKKEATRQMSAPDDLVAALESSRYSFFFLRDIP